MIVKTFNFIRTVLKDDAGVSLTEFAVVAPIFLTLGMFGFEVSNMATTKMRVSQIALSLADNASRLGQTDNSAVTPTITEDDVAAVLNGALRQGQSIDLATNGRVILTSLEYDDDTGKQYIHWQRCVGAKDKDSAYGDENSKNGLSGSAITGLGKGADKITALPGSAVMFVEVYYDYSHIFPSPYGTDNSFREEAAFIIRDDRNLQDWDEKGLSGTAANTC